MTKTMAWAGRCGTDGVWLKPYGYDEHGLHIQVRTREPEWVGIALKAAENRIRFWKRQAAGCVVIFTMLVVAL